MRNAILLSLVLVLFHPELIAQEENKELKKEYRNTIRFNATNPILFGGKSIIFGYERILKNNRSFSVNLGQAGFPKFEFSNTDSLKSRSIDEEKGYHFSADYRFYLSKENKYAAPRGVYIGPYYSYNYIERKNSWEIKSTEGGPFQEVESKTSLSVNAIGFELGYQFVFWNHFSLDMILLGPGVAFYNLKALVGSNLSEADKQKFFDKPNQALADKLPGYDMVINEGEFES